MRILRLPYSNTRSPAPHPALRTRRKPRGGEPATREANSQSAGRYYLTGAIPVRDGETDRLLAPYDIAQRISEPGINGLNRTVAVHDQQSRLRTSRVGCVPAANYRAS